MTAVATPNFHSRPAWPINGNMNQDMFVPRKTLSRTNSSSSVSSTLSNSSATTVASNGSQANGTPMSSTTDLSQWSGRKRTQPKSWPAKELQPGRMMAQPRPAEQFPPGQPVLYLLSLNGTFERKTIAVPLAPDSLRIGRQTNQKTIPTPTNGFFDSKVLSRQHAEIYAERNGKIYIRDVKSSNGTFVNGTRLSQENRESEPHELQTADHLELGIDIVSEDQKTVVHHKVAAKVEHAGFLSSSNNVLEMNFGDLDPANGAMMMPGVRGRAPSNASMGRMPMVQNGMPQQRPFFLTPIATDQILKRLANEMRSARLQAQDLGRTNQFVNTLLSKDDVKDMEKPEAKPNGFREKPRFSDPPAPPPQQPLPEKPDSLKRPKANSPVRPDNLSQIVQLTEALNSARRDIDSQTTRMRELEEMLLQEQSARKEAEEAVKRLEAKVPEPEPVPDPEETANVLQARIDVMDNQMQTIKEQMEGWKNRCEAAEAERDADRKTLAEMVVQLRAEEAKREEVQRDRSRSRQRHAEAIKPPPEPTDAPTLSRANTITPNPPREGFEHIQATMPFASMLGVVLFGMGLMAYLNGWQARPLGAER